MNDIESYIATLLVIIVLLLILWRYYLFKTGNTQKIIEAPEVKVNKKNKKIRSNYDSGDKQSDTESEMDMIDPKSNSIRNPVRNPIRLRVRRRFRIIRQPFPVGLPELPILTSNPTFLTQTELNVRYGEHLPFSNPPPPNGPAFAGGYGPPEVPAAGGLRR